MNDEIPYPVLERGSSQGSVSAKYRRDESSEVSVSIPDRRLGPYLHRLAEGGILIDKVGIPFRVMVQLSWVSPLLSLNPDRCDDVVGPLPADSVAMFAQGAQGVFQTVAKYQQANPSWTGLSMVSLLAYTSYWREAGALIGVREGDKIVCEDGSTWDVWPEDHPALWSYAHPLDVRSEAA